MDLSELKKMITSKIMENEPMHKHTSYGIGGPAMAYIEPKSIKDIQSIKSFAKRKDLRVYCIGSGSNLLVSDEGINGIVISLQKTIKNIMFDQNICYAETGAKLSKLVKECIKRNLGGMETLIGIPGTIGGALIMNAGAFGNEISNYVTNIELIDQAGNINRQSISDLEFNYRESNFSANAILLSAEFQLEKIDDSIIIKQRDTANQTRKSTQPLKARSAGSVFKNPKDHAAGYLIDQVGLKGMSIGGAIVSEIHANFIINHSDAKATDVVELINMIRKSINDKYSINLELEINTLGFPEGTFDA